MQWCLVAFSGLVLLTGWIFFLRTTAKSLGFVGVVLSLALAGAFLWILLYYDLVSTASTQLLSWIVLVLFAAILCAGIAVQDIVFKVAQQIHVLSYGKLLAHGTAEEIRNHPKVIEAYLGQPQGTDHG